MFNGIVETTGVVRSVQTVNDCLVVNIEPLIVWTDVKMGESIAVNGVCLTVTEQVNHGFLFTIVPETLRLTNLRFLKEHSRVNIERAMRAGDRISGHRVEGHVEGLAVIESIQEEGDAWLVRLSTTPALMKSIVPKGFVCLDGMSITVIDHDDTSFSVTLIPHTRLMTIANEYHAGSMLNLETDIYLRMLNKQKEVS